MTDGPVHGTWEPEPAARWEDGFLSGNGHHGALLFGEPDDERVVVTHHTLVRPNGAEHARPPRTDDIVTVSLGQFAAPAGGGMPPGRNLFPSSFPNHRSQFYGQNNLLFLRLNSFTEADKHPHPR